MASAPRSDFDVRFTFPLSRYTLKDQIGLEMAREVLRMSRLPPARGAGVSARRHKDPSHRPGGGAFRRGGGTYPGEPTMTPNTLRALYYTLWDPAHPEREARLPG